MATRGLSTFKPINDIYKLLRKHSSQTQSYLKKQNKKQNSASKVI